MISHPVDGRGRRGAHHGRGRESPAGRGRGFGPPPASSARTQARQQGPLIGQPDQQVSEDTYPPGFLKQQQQPLQGFIVSLLDSYGFIRYMLLLQISPLQATMLKLAAQLDCKHACRVPGDQQQIFFHGSEVHNTSNIPDEQFNMQHLLQLGDEVSFHLKHIAHKEKKVNAVNIRKLEAGTIAALQSASRGRYRGIVKTVPGEASWRSSVSLMDVCSWYWLNTNCPTPFSTSR